MPPPCACPNRRSITHSSHFLTIDGYAWAAADELSDRVAAGGRAVERPTGVAGHGRRCHLGVDLQLLENRSDLSPHGGKGHGGPAGDLRRRLAVDDVGQDVALAGGE